MSRAEKKVIIIGAGPAGLFAALQLIEAGIQPIVLERGKDVKSRRRDWRP
ncbi:FAD-dependent monooxygenase [Niabella sp. W65]|nr:FAD-dependent monooxygenase [Niabella sp. W65]MCH7362099.1 FAD-dependent monooxygenase [Niabella sp. W65]